MAETEEQLRARLADLTIELERARGANEQYAMRAVEDERQIGVLNRALNIIERGVPPAQPEPRPPRKDLGLQTLIKPWSGGADAIPVEEFITKFRTVGRTGNWTTGDMEAVCRLKLSGSAAAYIEGHATLSQIGEDFEGLAAGLIRRFTDPRAWELREEELRTLLRKPKEGIRDFADRVTEIGRRAVRPGGTAEETRCLRAEGERRALKAFVRGLGGEVGRTVALENPQDMVAAVDRALEVESTLKGLPEKEAPKRVLAAQAGEGDEEERAPPREMVCAASYGTTPCQGCTCRQRASGAPTTSAQTQNQLPPPPIRAQPVRCYRCNGEGHIARYCPYPPPVYDPPYGKGYGAMAPFVQTPYPQAVPQPIHGQPRPLMALMPPPPKPMGEGSPSGGQPYRPPAVLPPPEIQCYRCSGYGHIARYCPKNPMVKVIEVSPNGTGTREAPPATPEN